jgi:hypothetical protein
MQVLTTALPTRLGAIQAKRDKREARLREEEKKEQMAQRQRATRLLFEDAERRILERAAAADERKRQSQLRFEAEQAERNRLVAEQMAAAKARIEGAQKAMERLADETRRQFAEREAQLAAKRAEQARENEEHVRQTRERQLALALRRGKIFDKMKSDEEARVHELLSKMMSQEEMMEQMARERRLMAAMREEQRRLSMQDKQQNIARLMRAKEHEADLMRLKNAEDDEREALRKRNKAALIEHQRLEAAKAERAKQELLDQLAKARSPRELQRLSGMIPGSAAGATAAVPSSLPSADRLSAGTSAEIGATLSGAAQDGAAQDGAAQDGAAQDGAEEDDAEEDDASELDEAYAALVDVPMFEAEMGEMAAWRAMATIEGPPTKSLEASAPRAHPKPPTIPPSGNAAPRPSTARTLKPAASESETDYEPAQVMGRPSTAGARLA